MRDILLELFCAEEGVSFDSVRDLPYSVFIRFLNYIQMVLAAEFGYFVEGPNEQGARNMTLGEYLKLKNETTEKISSKYKQSKDNRVE